VTGTTSSVALPYPPDEPSLVAVAADRCSRLAAVAAAVADELTRDGGRLAAAWSGPAAVGCRAELGAATRVVGSLSEPLHRSAAELRAHGELLREARAEVDRLRTDYDERVAAHRRDLTALLSDSSWPGPVRRLQAADLLAAQQLELVALHRRHQDVLDRVVEHAQATARRIRAAAGSVGPVARAGGAPVADREAELAGLLPLLAASRLAAGVGAGALPGAGTAAVVVRQWWAALTSDERDRAVMAWPAELGALDGLPAAVRSTANERRLDRDVAALQRQQSLTPEQLRWLANCLVVRQQLAQARAAGEAAQLLVFDPTAFGYEGRAAIAVGDVDTADNVAFLVPGLGSDVLDTTASLTRTALRVETEAHRVAPAETTATVAWVGYDAPSLAGGIFDDAAQDGAELLADDVLAVQASRQLAPHLTVVAHSYGSTTAGVALRETQTGADDLVLVGSPGAGVEHAADLNVPAGHVFVGASSRDPVSYVDRFGADPSDESFGAVRFEAEAVGRSWHLSFGDHGRYFDPHSESLANIAHVVTGDYAGVVPAPYREDVFLLPDGINSDPESGREPTTVP
jgi:cell division septum initiation protein DivIVA